MATNTPESQVNTQIDINDAQSDIAAEIIGSPTPPAVEETIVRPERSPSSLEMDMEAVAKYRQDQEDAPPTAADTLGLSGDLVSEDDQLKQDIRKIEQQRAIGVIAPESVDDRIQQMKSAEGIYTREESNRTQQVADISKEFGIDPLIVDAELEVNSPEVVRTKAKIPRLAREMPVLAKWMTKPKNYVLAENTGDWTEALSASTLALNPKKKSEVLNTFKRTVLEYPKAAIYTSLLSGVITPEQAREGIDAVEAEQAKFEISAKSASEMKRLSEAEANLRPSLLQTVEGVRDSALHIAMKAALALASEEEVKAAGPLAIKMNNEELNEFIIPSLQKAYNGSEEAFEGILEYLRTMYENPTGAKLTTTQAAVTSGVPLGLIVGGAGAGAVLKSDAVARAGLVSGLGLTAMLTASSSLEEDLEEFRNPNTGVIDLKAAFSDPIRVSRWRKRAAAYSGVMAASEFVYSKFVGGMFTKAVKGTGSGAVATATKSVGAGALEESASEFTATVARDAIVNEVTEKGISEAGAKAVTEGIYGAILGGGIGIASGTIRTGKQKYFKIKDDIKKASDANSDTVDVHELKQVFNSDESSKTNKSQIQDLIDAGIEPPPLPEINDIYADEDSGAKEYARAKSEAVALSTVTISPQEVTQYFDSVGVNTEEALSTLPDEIFDNFLDSRDSDTSVTIPISEWVAILDQHPEVDTLVRAAGNELNSVEANELIETIQDNPFQLFQKELPPIPQDEVDGDIPPLPQDVNAEAIPPELPQATTEEDFDESEVINVDEVRTPFLGPVEQKAYETIRRRIKSATKDAKGITGDAAIQFADIQFQVLKNRAENTGRSLEDLAQSIKITGGSKGGVGGTFNILTKNLFFSNTAEANVLPHEFGHSWLDAMSEDYHFMSGIPFDEMTSSQKDYWYSMTATARLLGLDNMGALNAQDLSSEENTKIHEIFAETSEEYFLSGKFGDIKVKAAMEAFRAHMVKILDIIRGTVAKYIRYGNLEVTPEVERIFSGIIGVSQQIDETLNPMFPESIHDPSLLGEEAAKHYETVRDVISETVGTFASKIMNRSYKEREALVSEAYDESYSAATEIVEAQPTFMLADQLKDQYDEFRGKVKLGQKAPDPRISYSSFAAIFDGDETAIDIARKIIPNYVIAGKKKGGQDISVLMHATGFTSSEDFINMLMEMGTKDKQIEVKAEEILNEQYPILKSDKDIRDDAVESMSNKKMSSFLQVELKMLGSKYLPTLKGLTERFIISPETMSTTGYLNEKASETISKAPVATFNPKSYRNDFGRHSKNAATFFRKGDFASAFDSKVKSIISYKAHILAQATAIKLGKVDKLSKLIIKYSGGKDYADRYNPELMLFGKAFITAATNRKAEMPRLDIEAFPDGSGVDQSVVDQVNSLIDSFEEQTQGRRGVLITTNGYLHFGSVLKSLRTIAIQAKKTELGNKSIRLEVLQEGVTEEIEASVSAPVNYRRGRRTLSISNIRADKDNVYSVFASLFKNDIEFNKSFLGQMFSSLDKAQADRSIAVREDTKIIQDAFIKIANTFSKTKSANLFGPIVSRVGAGSLWQYDPSQKPIISEELGITFNDMGEYVMAALIMGSESGANKFLRGGTTTNPNPLAEWTLDGIDMTAWNALQKRLIDEGSLKKEHFDAMQTIWDLMRAKHNPVKESLRKNDGWIMGSIEGRDVETPWGTYKGAYIPIARDKELTDAATFETLIDPDSNRVSPTELYPKQRTGLSDSRKSDTYYPVDLNPGRLLTYASAANDIIHMRADLKTFGKVFMDNEVRRSLETKRPGAYGNVVIPWFTRVVNQQRTEISSDQLNKFASRLKKNINTSLYLGNGLTAVKQQLGYIPALVSVKPKYLMRGLAESTARPEATMEWIKQDTIMKDRFEATFKRMINDWDDLQTHEDWIDDLEKGVEKATFFLIQMSQNRVDMGVYTGAYEQAVSEGLNDRQSRSFANQVVQSTQNSSSVTWRNRMQSKGALYQLILGISTNLMFTMNNLVTKEVNRNANLKSKAQVFAAIATLVYFLPSFLEQGVEQTTKALIGGDDEDEVTAEERLALMVKRAATNTLSPLAPIYGQMLNSVFYSGSPNIAPTAQLVSKTGFAALNASRSALKNQVPLTPYEMKGMLKMMTIVSGVPTSLFARDFLLEKVWIESLNGETVDDRLKERRYKLRKLKRAKRREERAEKRSNR